ncbi:MAG TPA: hypothetical protein VHL98_08625 [Microvirga sp.]|jgi:hypothetical protein|nr:hypothetical protein [Microvirga sp.]
MVEFSVLSSGGPSVAVLFSPGTVPIVDIFRALGDFEDHYDVAALDALEDDLARAMGRDTAKGIVSDALLLAFGLRRERPEPMQYAPRQSRRGTLDEYRLVSLLSATYWHDFVLASEAAAALEIIHPQPLISLAFDISRRLESAGMKLDAPDPRVFRPAAQATTEVVVERIRPVVAPLRQIDG